MSHPQVLGIQFDGGGKYGDFGWMITRPEYKDDFFIFNENVEDFQSKSRSKGGGNAIIRPYVFSNPPMAGGIPAGYKDNIKSPHYKGFKHLDDEVKSLIDGAVDAIAKIVKKRKVRHIYYISRPNDGILGSSIFKVDENVLKYITDQIKSLSNITYDGESILESVRKISKQSPPLSIHKFEKRHKISELVLLEFPDKSMGVCGNVREHLEELNQMGGSEPDYNFVGSFNNILMSGYYFDQESYNAIYEYFNKRPKVSISIVKYNVVDGKRRYGLFGNLFAYRNVLPSMGAKFKHRLLFKGPGEVTTPIVYFDKSARLKLQKYIYQANRRLMEMSDIELQTIYDEGFDNYEKPSSRRSGTSRTTDKTKERWYNDEQELGIQSYSDSSIAVFGNTYPHKEELMKAGGKFNRFLERAYPDAQGYNEYKKTPGFIFPSKKYDEVVALVDDINAR